MNTLASTLKYSKWLPMWEGRQIHYFLQFVEPEVEMKCKQQLELLKQLTSCAFDPRITEFPFFVNHVFHATRLMLSDGNHHELVNVKEICNNMAAWTSMSLRASSGGSKTVVASRDNCRVPTTRTYSYESPLYIVNGNSSDDCDKLWDEALALLKEVNLHYFPILSIGVIVNLDERGDGDAMSGYTLSPFTGTIFTDYTANIIRYAETIVHEAAHSYLNALLLHHNVNLDKEKSILWSPWRNTLRPLFGIVHGLFAFSIVTLFYHRLLQQDICLNDMARNYCNNRLDFEFSRLLMLKDQLDDVMKLVSNVQIEQLLLNYLPFSHEQQYLVYQEG